MRRYFSLMESDFPTELGAAYRSMENSGNPWGLSQADRAAWTSKVDGVSDRRARRPLQPRVLYWVGCAGSFDDKNQKGTDHDGEAAPARRARLHHPGPV